MRSVDISGLPTGHLVKTGLVCTRSGRLMVELRYNGATMMLSLPDSRQLGLDLIALSQDANI